MLFLFQHFFLLWQNLAIVFLHIRHESKWCLYLIKIITHTDLNPTVRCFLVVSNESVRFPSCQYIGPTVFSYMSACLFLKSGKYMSVSLPPKVMTGFVRDIVSIKIVVPVYVCALFSIKTTFSTVRLHFHDCRMLFFIV